MQQPISPTDDRQADWAPGVRPHNDESLYQGTIRLAYKLTDDIDFTSITSYQHFKENNSVDQGGVGMAEAVAHIRGQATSVYQELRLGGHFGSKGGSWILGFNYANDKNNEDDLYQPINISGDFITGGSAFSAVPIAPLSYFGARNTAKANTTSVFAHVEYPIVSTVTFNAGIRYTQSNQTMAACGYGDAVESLYISSVASQLAGAFGGSAPTPFSAGQCGTLGPAPNFQPGLQRNTLDESNVPWRAGLDWRPGRGLLLYFSVSKGYKAGTSPSIVATSYTELKPVKQESLLAYELGAKLTLAGGLLQLNGAVFHYEYRDKQELGRVIDPLGIFGALQTLLNIPKSKENGAELSVVIRPVSGLTLNGNVTYLESKVTSDFNNYSPYVLNVADTVNFKGEAFPDTPRWSVQYGARYDWRASDRLLAYVAADASYQSATYGAFGASHADDIGAPSLGVKPYSLLNLSVGVQSADKRWLVELFGRNVTNTYYWNTAFWNGDTTLRFAGMPATYGIRLGFKY